MKRLLVGMILALNTQAAVDLHRGCYDQTFAYNKMSVIELEDSIQFDLQGARIFKLEDVAWEGGARTVFDINKDNCRLSEDRLLITCHSISELFVERTNPIFGGPHDSDEVKTVRLQDVMVSISFEESAFSTKFNLESSYVIEGDDKRTHNRVSFPGDKESGCKKFRGGF